VAQAPASPTPSHSVESWIHHADTHLYEAKRSRNRVVLAPAPCATQQAA